MVLVKVQRITSYTDPETMRPGKIIELVEVRRSGGFQPAGLGEESLMVQRMLQNSHSISTRINSVWTMLV